MIRRSFWGMALALMLASLPLTVQAKSAFPPSPYDILGNRDLETPLLDAVGYCVPDGLDAAIDPILEHTDVSEWQEARRVLTDWARNLDRPGLELVVFDAVLQSREADDREAWLEAEEWFRSLLRRKDVAPHALCARLELARLLLLMGRESEAAAQLTRAERWIDEFDEESSHIDDVAFWRAEILYRRDNAFDAHLAYRKLTKSKNARLALAARLRLTDLSFDSGKIEQVSDEYEALLPRASAFGASTLGWARRASEAALDAGDPGRALRWLERFLEAGGDRNSRDAVEIRLADLDVSYDDPMLARKRLSAVSGKRRADPIGALASIRAIDLGVAPGSPDQRLDLLMVALRDQRQGVRRYTLGVLMDELAHRGDLDGALAVATRLAYEGVDAVVTPDYVELLDDLLTRVADRHAAGGECRRVIRALGGRYGILIERASSPRAFATVGECFEEMELPWLAATLYRTIARRYGVAGAEVISLPLARTSLTIGEITLARRVASAALEDPDDRAIEWRAILAEADFREERFREAASGFVRVLDNEALVRDRGKFARMLGLTLANNRALANADYLAQRLPAWLASKDLEPGASAALIEAAMLTAHAYREANQVAKSLEVYRLVDQYAEAGAMRSSARFWLGLSNQQDSQGNPAWGEDPAITMGAPWGRYARFETNLESLWSAYRSEVE